MLLRHCTDKKCIEAAQALGWGGGRTGSAARTFSTCPSGYSRPVNRSHSLIFISLDRHNSCSFSSLSPSAHGPRPGLISSRPLAMFSRIQESNGLRMENSPAGVTDDSVGNSRSLVAPSHLSNVKVGLSLLPAAPLAVSLVLLDFLTSALTLFDSSSYLFSPLSPCLS